MTHLLENDHIMEQITKYLLEGFTSGEVFDGTEENKSHWWSLTTKGLEIN